MKRSVACVVVILAITLPLAAVEVELYDGTIISAESVKITGSFVFLTLENGARIGYALEDVKPESLQAKPQEEPAAEQDRPAQKSAGLVNGLVNLGILHAGFACHHQRQREYDAGRVHGPVSIAVPARPGEAVAPRAHRALPTRDLAGDPLQAAHDRLVAGGRGILRQEQTGVTVVPRGECFHVVVGHHASIVGQ